MSRLLSFFSVCPSSFDEEGDHLFPRVLVLLMCMTRVQLPGSVAAAQKSCRDWIKQTIIFIVSIVFNSIVIIVFIVSRSIVLIQLD